VENIDAIAIGYLDAKGVAVIQPMNSSIVKECTAKGFTLLYANDNAAQEKFFGFWTTKPPLTPNKQFKKIYPKRVVVHHKQCAVYLPEDYHRCNCGAE